MKQILIVVSCLAFFACKKDSPATTEKTCEELPAPPGIGWDYLIDSPYFTFPHFNPNNPNEIIFQEKNYSGGASKLFKFNLTTKQKSLLLSESNLFQPKWGKNDWILLNLSDANIWKIKSNGDSLTQLTNSNSDYAPEWDLSSEKFCFYRSMGAFQKLIIADSDGFILDTLNNFYSAQSSWQHPNLIVTTSGMYGLHTINPLTDSITVLLQQMEPSLESSIWLGNNVDILFTAENGIFKMSYHTGEITCIKSSCFTKNYLFPTYSSISNKIIFQRVDQNAINSHTVEVKSSLFMMNTDGSNEEEIGIE